MPDLPGREASLASSANSRSTGLGQPSAQGAFGRDFHLVWAHLPAELESEPICRCAFSAAKTHEFLCPLVRVSNPR
jgi:hypothetical protein